MTGTEIEKRSDGVAEIADLDAELQRAKAEAEALVDVGPPSTGTDLVHVGSSAPATKRDMARRKQQLAKKRAEVESISERMREAMEKRMNAALEIIEPMREMIRQLEEGIWMVNLYLGRDEKIVTLRKGDAAPKDTPLSIRQLVLSMDEETAIDPEEGGIDFNEVSRFDEWLTADEARIEQVIPDLKGVVAIRPRAESPHDYGSSWANSQAAEEDEHTYFLIRNGDALYRLWTEFSVGDTMIPTTDEFTELFRRTRYNFDTEEDEIEEFQPGDFEFERASKEVEERQRHYMRMGLVLQGLVDRTAVFHPLPDGGVNFLTAESHDEGAVKFIMDAEQTIDTGREPFKVWQSRINSELRPGMRVVGAFNSEAFRGSNAYERNSRYGHSRISPGNATYPDSYVPLTIEGRNKEGDLFVRYQRTDKRYDTWEGSVPYKNKASVSIRPADDFIIALDFAEVEDMEAYMRARTERKEYLNMFPLLKAAILVKREEAAAEAPFLQLIAAQLVVNNDVSIEEANRVVPKLVQWWKFKNRQHRALAGSGEDRKALTEIVAEHANRQKLDKTATPPKLLKDLERTHPDAVLIARRPDGKHVVLKPENSDNVFVAIGVYNRSGKLKESKRWKLPPTNILSWRIFYESPRWKSWLRGASLTEYLTGPEMQEFANSVVTDETIAVTYDVRSHRIEEWKADEVTVPRKARVRYAHVNRVWPASDYTWSRDRGKAVLRLSRGYGREHRYSGKRPWEPKGRAQYGEKRILLYENHELISAAETRLEKAEAMEKAGIALSSIYTRAIRSVLEQWKDLAERKRYEEFIAEYADPELWEGHKKTLDRLEHPDELNNPEFLIPLIEEGRKITGMTLGGAAAVTGADLSPEYAEFVINAEPAREDDDDDDYDD